MLLIFDLDGVLVDSERLAFSTLCASLAEAGVTLDAGLAMERFLGWREADICATVETEAGRPLPPDFSTRRMAHLLESIRRELRPVPGVAELLGASAVARCVASSSPMDRIRASLEATGLSALFAPEAVFSGSSVPHGKPAPDLFLHAARAMGHTPAGCVVVEDSVAGVQAGVAAHMRVLGFAGAGHVEPAAHAEALRAAGAHTVLHAMAELPPLLAGLAAG